MRQRDILLAIAVILLAGMSDRNLLFSSQEQQDKAEPSADLVRWDQLIASEQQEAKISLGAGYVVGGVKLEPGKYLVIHQRFAATDEEVTSFYRLLHHFGPQAVARVRCTAIEGARVGKFTIQATTKPDGTLFLYSIQFAGSNEIHSFEKGEVYLGHTYSVGGVPLERGKYVVIHRSDRDHQSDPCMFFYHTPYHAGQEAVAKVHCMPQEGPPAMEGVVVKSTLQPDGTSLVHSIQFTGSTEVHSFPSGS